MTLACEENIDYITDLSIFMARTIFFISTSTAELTDAVRRYIALKYLDTVKSKYTAKDPAFEQELEYCLNEQLALVKSTSNLGRTLPIILLLLQTDRSMSLVQCLI